MTDGGTNESTSFQAVTTTRIVTAQTNGFIGVLNRRYCLLMSTMKQIVTKISETPRI
jgi:hypothetical protein